MSTETARAIVLAAGKGVRMKSERAKVLHELLGRPVLHYVLKSLRAAGVKNVVAVVGYQEDEVRKAAGDGVTFVRQTEQKGTGHAVRCCEDALRGFKGDVIVLAGDAPLISDASVTAMLETHRKAGAACTVLTARLDDPRGYGRIVRDAKGNFARIVEELDATDRERRLQEVNSGHYVFGAPALFEALRGVKADNRKGEYYLTDVLALLLKRRLRVATFQSADPAEVRGINTRQDLVDAARVLRARIVRRHLENGVAILDPSATWIEDDVEIGADTVIRPYTVIEHDVRIGRHCEVGPFSHLRPGAVLEDHAEIGNFVEVKKSRIGRHSKAKHLTYLGDATLGEHVNIGAGTITANFDGTHKNATVIEDGASTGSNTVLVAPVRMGRGSKTGGGAVVLAGHDVAPGDIVVGVPARSVHARPEEAPKKPVQMKAAVSRGRKK